MALTIRNTRELIDPSRFRMKILIYAVPGFGKTEFISGAPSPLIAASEHGQGDGLLSVAERGLTFFTPDNMSELDSFAAGILYDSDKKKVDFSKYETLIEDSFSEVTKQHIKAEALSIPRNKGDSPKRAKGVAELDDYGTMGELSRKHLAKLLDWDKHIVVTATIREVGPDEDHPNREHRIGPDLPGAMFTGATAMFDFVLAGVIKSVLRDPEGNIVKDPLKAKGAVKSTARVWLTNPQTSGAYLTKCRASLTRGGNTYTEPLLDSEEVYDLKAGTGTWKYLYNKILVRYQEAFEKARTA